MQPIRLAVIGAGKLGGYHANLAAKLDAFELVAVVDPVLDAAETLAKKADCEAFTDAESIRGRIDAAVVATPTVTHRATAQPLLDDGAHVLVEKPIAPSKADADALVDAAERAGSVLQVGHVERFNPALAATEPLSDPKLIRATRTSGFTFRSTDVGAVLDLMIHDIDLALSLAKSPVVDVRAMGLSVLGSPARGEHEDIVTAELCFANGCVAQLTASRVSYELNRDMQVFGADGFVAYDFAKGEATTVRPNHGVLDRSFDASALSAEEKAEMFAGRLFQEVLVKEQHASPAVNAIELELLDFANAINTGAGPRVSGVDGRDAVAVAERILACVDAHEWDGSSIGRVGRYAAPTTELRKSA